MDRGAAERQGLQLGFLDPQSDVFDSPIDRLLACRKG
jgi:hypothetical protein